MTPNTKLLSDWLSFTSPPTIPPISYSPDTFLPPATIAAPQFVVDPNASPPQFSNLGKSLLLNRRSAVRSDGSYTTTQNIESDVGSTSLQSRKAMSDSILKYVYSALQLCGVAKYTSVLSLSTTHSSSSGPRIAKVHRRSRTRTPTSFPPHSHHRRPACSSITIAT